MSTRAAAASFALIVGALAGAAPAAAELTMSASSTPATISFPHPAATLTYRVTLAATGHDETFSLGFAAPPFDAKPIGFSPAGTSLMFTSENPVIEGPATLAGGASGSQGSMAACGPQPVHGFAVESRKWDVLVPAGTTSSMSFGFAPARSSPWPDTSYDVEFVASPKLAAGGTGTLAAERTAIARGPHPTGRRGVRVTLKSHPRSAPLGFRGMATVRKGRRISLTGSTLPARPGKTVRLYIKVATSWRGFHLFKTVTTDRHGRFHTATRAPAHGFQIMARIPADRPAFDSDYGCPLGFGVHQGPAS